MSVLYHNGCIRALKINSNLLLSFFAVLENEEPRPRTKEEDESALPDWGIAVIVIGLGSFAFVLVFGITVVGVSWMFCS